MSSFTLFRSFLTFYHNKLCLEVIAQERENETIIRKEKSVFRKLLNGKMFSNQHHPSNGWFGQAYKARSPNKDLSP
jgi:hypothetical protein